MARIRSIKPDFFTSETVASLPLSTRLTFIGLWTYVDDNGVGMDNELLINAAIWPLEGDSLETLARTREDLATLSRAGLVNRYRDSRKRYLFVTSWDEHQKVDHPRKPRYPRPGDVIGATDLTSDNESVDQTLATDSRENREDLARKEFEGERNVLAAKNESLEKAGKDLNAANIKLAQQLEAAYQKVQDIAEKTVEGTSQAKSLADLQKLFVEQSRKAGEKA